MTPLCPLIFAAAGRGAVTTSIRSTGTITALQHVHRRRLNRAREPTKRRLRQRTRPAARSGASGGGVAGGMARGGGDVLGRGGTGPERKWRGGRQGLSHQE